MVNVKWIKGKMDFYVKSKSFRKLKIKFQTIALGHARKNEFNGLRIIIVMAREGELHSILRQPHIESLEKFSLKITKA